MPTFKIRYSETVFYVADIEAETIAEAVEMVEDGDVPDWVEYDSTPPEVIEFAEEGVMGWNRWPVEDPDAPTVEPQDSEAARPQWYLATYGNMGLEVRFYTDPIKYADAVAGAAETHAEGGWDMDSYVHGDVEA